jgi:transcription elongation factor GreA
VTTETEQSIQTHAEIYLAGLPAERRGPYNRDIQKFLRWVGGGRTPESLTGHEIERFGAEVVDRSPGTAEAVRAFLAYLKQKGHTRTNLGTNIRVRRTASRGTTTAQPRETIKMTAEGLTRLKEELQGLIAQRPLIAEELRRAMADKDFRENAPLDAARDRQAHIEARIRDLENQLRAAEVVEAPEAGVTTVQLGTTAVLFDEKYQEEVRYTLVSATEAEPRRGRISIASPTGKALLGRSAGDKVEVETPGGLHRYELKRIEV